MQLQGSLERILDSVLPHEVTHTILATHLRRKVPRWADEGASTTVEHSSERAKQQKLLVQFLKSNRGISFAEMFALKEYPHDVLPLYAQGYSVARFLIAQRGCHVFLQFLQAGMKNEEWTLATLKYYRYESLGELQDAWLDWVRGGSQLREIGRFSKLQDHLPGPVTREDPEKLLSQSTLLVQGGNDRSSRQLVHVPPMAKAESPTERRKGNL